MPGFTIRPERTDDTEVAAIADVVAAAFGSPAEAELVRRIRASENYLPSAALVAVSSDDGRVLGHVMVSHVGLRRPDGTLGSIASLSPLAVHPDHQRSGIGSALVHAVVAVADELGEPLVVLEGSPAYYGRLGFEYSVPLGISIHLPDWAPAEAAQVRRLANYDAAITGTVEYPPAFDDVT
ncbi:GNAT family N-acetyltransferase [Desertimonas flava]|jgi:putative acetyltransferase|uniref:GNAT family N-acetyltransferase n=1 Tax=Desertimonas flava TaxID=2064846 RepID=UPI000E34524F|nr:N-acetyltransferase [Desertimonas flava]